MCENTRKALGIPPEYSSSKNEPLDDELVDAINDFSRFVTDLLHNPPDTLREKWLTDYSAPITPDDEIFELRKKVVIEECLIDNHNPDQGRAEEYLKEIADCFAKDTLPSKSARDYFCSEVALGLENNQGRAKSKKGKVGRPKNFKKHIDTYLRVVEERSKPKSERLPIRLGKGGLYDKVGEEHKLSGSGAKSACDNIERQLKDEELLKNLAKTKETNTLAIGVTLLMGKFIRALKNMKTERERSDVF
ncbi:MAG: hypothetical protein ABL903_02055 [Methylococcales bacterium]